MSAAPEIEFDQASVAQRMRDTREATRGVSEGFSRAYMRECIDNHRFPQEAWEALGEYGLLGITIPEELGGSGGGQVELVALMETLAELCQAAGDHEAYAQRLERVRHAKVQARR